MHYCHTCILHISVMTIYCCIILRYVYTCSAAATPVGQRVILPAATPHQTIRITGTQSLAHIKSQLPIGATILSSNDSSGQMLAFLPNNQSLIQQKVCLTNEICFIGQTRLHVWCASYLFMQNVDTTSI